MHLCIYIYTVGKKINIFWSACNEVVGKKININKNEKNK